VRRYIPILLAAAAFLVIGAKIAFHWKEFSELARMMGNNDDYAWAARAAAEEERLKREPAETDPAKWQALLQQLSELAIADKEIRGRLTAEQIEKRWLGEPPATEEQIVAAEERLGIRLPPSYRAFLKVSNGWHYPTYAITRLASVQEIGPTRDLDPVLVNAWADNSSRPESDLPNTVLVSIPSDYDDGDRLMLNPQSVQNGEMEAWSFSNAYPGADPQPSFWHLMASQAISWRFMAAAGQ